MAMTLDQLRGFVAVAEELHFGRAAERLRMTQPPLSRQVQKLERAVGAQLLERDNRRVALTAAGAAFLEEARRLLALAESAPVTARRVSSGARGLVRIGFTAAAAYGPLGELLNTLGRELPEVDLDLRETVSRTQRDALRHGDLDLGLVRPPVDEDEFGSRCLHREHMLVAVPAGHRLTTLGRPVGGRDLADEPVIMYSPTEARYFYDLVVSSLPVVHGNVVHTVGQVLTMLWLVAAGRGLAFVPASAARLGVPGVQHVPLATPEPEPVELHLLWSRGSRNPALRRALEVVGALDPLR
ncbi:LysR family transcriptional regulator [Kineococcus sp. G2]|uniref:LysR family transcriptional regulator n=1 Tax=Kineococcus sp. G2 TaxID=3127484 RepID=UPI00301D2254